MKKKILNFQAFKIDKDGTAPTSNLTSAEANDIITCELTRTEFAEALSMKPTATFVVKMFELVDKDNNGYISFREFLDMLIIFAQGIHKNPHWIYHALHFS